MRTSEIVEIDNLLDDKDTFTFNPSLAYWKDDLYLCSYRSFKRYKDINYINREGNPTVEPNHPWLGGNNATTWWRSVNGLDATGFATIRLINNVFTNVYNYKNVELYNLAGNISTNYSKLLGVDARILHLKGDFFIVSYNKYFRDTSRVKNATCTDGCFAIATRLLKLKDDKIIFFGENIMCQNISNTTEKNWSFWVYRGNIFFSYSLVPKHIFYKVTLNLSDGSMQCAENIIADANGIITQAPFAYGRSVYYDRLEKEYNGVVKPNFLNISLSTPSIRKRASDNYISVGHVKYLNDDKYIRLIQTTPLGLFYKRYNFSRHPIYDYLMFIYEFSPYDGKIIKVSDMFLPADSDYALAFPAGITYDANNNLLISYGDHDTKSKICVIADYFVEKMLHVVGKKNSVLTPSAEELNFFILPKVCENTAGMCKILANF